MDRFFWMLCRQEARSELEGNDVATVKMHGLIIQVMKYAHARTHTRAADNTQDAEIG